MVENPLKRRVSRREALSTAGKIAVTAGVTAVVVGAGSYLAGQAVAPARTVTQTVTGPERTATQTLTSTQTVTSTMTAPSEFPKLTFHWCSMNPAHPFYLPIIDGANDAGKLVNCETIFTGPDKFDVAKLVDMIYSVIERRPDGISMAIFDVSQYEPGREAMRRGIPVLAVNALARPPPDPTVKPFPYLCFVGQDMILSGRRMGDEIAKLIPPGKGTAVVWSSTIGEVATDDRRRGAVERLDELGVTHDFVGNSTADIAKSTDMLASYLAGHRETTKGFFGVDGNTPAGGIVVKEEGLVGKVFAGGFDLVPKTIEFIKEGTMQFTVDQQPYFQGYWPTLILQKYNNSHFAHQPTDVNTGLAVWTPENIDIIIKYRPKG